MGPKKPAQDRLGASALNRVQGRGLKSSGVLHDVWVPRGMHDGDLAGKGLHGGSPNSVTQPLDGNLLGAVQHLLVNTAKCTLPACPCKRQ